MRGMDTAFSWYRRKNLAFPRECLVSQHALCLSVSLQTPLGEPRFYLQADNTTKEVRHQSTSKLMCSLVQLGYYRAASHNHLQVGHTHEDVGYSVAGIFLFSLLIATG